MNHYAMFRMGVVVGLLVFQASVLFGQPDQEIKISDWKLIQAIDGSASVYAPRSMEVRIDSIETDIGQVLTIHHILKQSTEYSPNFLFHLSYTIYPDGLIHPDSTIVIQDLLKTTVDNAVLMQNAELLYSSDKSYKDYQGMIWKTKYADGAYVMKSEAYYVDDHLFMVQVGSMADIPTGEAVDHFFDSFKIKDPISGN